MRRIRIRLAIGLLRAVRGGLQVVEPRIRVGGRVRAVRDHARRHGAAAHRGAAVEPVVKPRVEAWLVNGALVAIAAVALFPVLWMMSMSVMAPGEASASPPPGARV